MYAILELDYIHRWCGMVSAPFGTTNQYIIPNLN